MSNKKAFAIPLIFIVIFLVSLAIGGFIYHYSSTISKEFFKDLAMSRGYWATFGAKEINQDMTYYYRSLDLSQETYNIKVTKNSLKYNWELIEINSGIKNSELWRRTLNIDNEIDKNIVSYENEE